MSDSTTYCWLFSSESPSSSSKRNNNVLYSGKDDCLTKGLQEIFRDHVDGVLLVVVICFDCFCKARSLLRFLKTRLFSPLCALNLACLHCASFSNLAVFLRVWPWTSLLQKLYLGSHHCSLLVAYLADITSWYFFFFVCCSDKIFGPFSMSAYSAPLDSTGFRIIGLLWKNLCFPQIFKRYFPLNGEITLNKITIIIMQTASWLLG